MTNDPNLLMGRVEFSDPHARPVGPNQTAPVSVAELSARLNRVEKALQIFAQHLRSLEDRNGLAPGLEAVVRAMEGLK